MTKQDFRNKVTHVIKIPGIDLKLSIYCAQLIKWSYTKHCTKSGINLCYQNFVRDLKEMYAIDLEGGE